MTTAHERTVNRPAAKYSVRTEVPAEVRNVLNALRAAEDDGTSSTSLTNKYLMRLHNAGWSYRALANAFGPISYQAIVARISSAATKDRDDDNSLDQMPRQLPVPRGTGRVTNPYSFDTYVIPDDVAARLRELQPIARRYRAHMAPDSDEARASRELTELMREQYDRGASFVKIGDAAGVTWSSVKFRLGRHGHGRLPKSQSYTLVQGAR